MGIESAMGGAPSSPAEEKRSYEEELRERRHDQDRTFLEKAGPEWSGKELPKPAGEWLQVSSAGNEPETYEHYGTYSVNNNKIAYCTKVDGGGGVVFVAPFSVDRMNTLDAAGYKKSSFGVPFSNGDMPFEARNKWEIKFPQAK